MMQYDDYAILEEMQTLVETLRSYNNEWRRSRSLNFPEIREKMQWYVAELTRLQEAFSPEAQVEFGDMINNIVEKAILIQDFTVQK